jgi:hypothetical protein
MQKWSPTPDFTFFANLEWGDRLTCSRFRDRPRRMGIKKPRYTAGLLICLASNFFLR